MSSMSKRARPKSAVPTSYKLFKECPLNTDEIPPVCDNEHLTGDCYCHLCSCGKHFCPADYKRNIISPSSHFSTFYRQSFKKFPCNYALQKPIPEFKPAHFPLDSMTTSKSDYKKPEIKKKKNNLYENFQKPVKFISKSNYSTEFTLYKETFPEKQYVMEPPYVKSESKFNYESQYRENFKDFASSMYIDNNNFASKLKKKGNGMHGIISPSNEFIGRSTQQQDFKKIIHAKAYIEKGMGPFIQNSEWKPKFVSTYKEDFSNPVFSKLSKKKYFKAKK